MADAVTSQTLVDDEENVVMKFTNISDSTGESAVKKVDVSALKAKGGDACSGVIIKKIVADVNGMSVRVFWDATSNVLCNVISASGTYDFSDIPGIGGLENNSGSGKTGDVLFTTNGHSSGDTYTIVLYMDKLY